MDLRGLEILHSAIRAQLQKKADCLVAALHVIFLNKGMKCLGKGDEFPAHNNERPSELLPDEWNSDPDGYSLRYLSRSGHKLLVKIVLQDTSMLINVFNAADAVAAGMSVDIDKHIPDDFRQFTGNYLNIDELHKNFGKDIARNVHLDWENPGQPDKSSSKEDKTSTRSPSPGVSSQENRDRAQPSSVPHQPVGSRDLDPLGRGRGGPGGGMLMDPESMGIPSHPTLPELGVGGPGGLPRGSVPPGARFDPIGPPSRRGPPSGPNPDHFRPPEEDTSEDFL